MGLDIYVGSLTRYLSGDWQTVLAEAAKTQGIEFATLCPDGERPAPDRAEVQETVAAWQSAMGDALGFERLWVDRADAPYATDQPHWLGYGAMVLLAARLERPDLARPDDSPEDFTSCPAFVEARTSGSDLFPSLIGGAEWWLPIPGVAATFTGSTVDGETLAMATLDLLERELDLLRERLGIEGTTLAEALLTGGPDPDDERMGGDAGYLREWGVFGLAVFLELTRQAQRMQLPLLLDY